MRTVLFIAAVAVVVGLSGCVERLITVRSEPSGAVVWLNDEEIGATPVTTRFMWYGVYDVVLRKRGYQTVRAARETEVPIYQWPLLDLVFETLPGDYVDHHEWMFELERLEAVDPCGLLERAMEMRAEFDPAE